MIIENLIPWISLTVFTPILGAILLAFVPGEHRKAHRHLTMAFMSFTFLFSLPLVIFFDSAEGGFQLTSAFEFLPWISALNAHYYVGVDGISIWLIMLTTFLGPIVTLASYSAIDENVKEYHIALLVLQTGMLGAFVALDLFLFYVFWELMLLPLYLLIGIWGGKDRIYAAVKLFLYTMVGSVLMLAAIIYVYVAGGMESLLISDMIEVARNLSLTEQKWLFVGFALSFLIKVPLFPFHTWLPDAHVQAPTAGSVILASILLKMGTYGLLRFAMPMFPDAAVWAAPYIGALSVIGILYGAMVALVQTDIKKLVAYSSVSHLGFVTLGLFAMTSASVTGAVFQSLAHGITTGGLFLAIGALYERRKTREFSEFGGLARRMPFFATVFVIISFGSVGVPGLVGFIGEFTVLFGTAQSVTLQFGEPTRLIAAEGFTAGPMVGALVFVTFAATGVIFGALYIFKMIQKTLFGPLDNEANKIIPDLNFREACYLMPMVLMAFIMGLLPGLFIKPMDASIDRHLNEIKDNVVEYREVVGAEAVDYSAYWRWLRDNRSDQPWSIQSESDSH